MCHHTVILLSNPSSVFKLRGKPKGAMGAMPLSKAQTRRTPESAREKAPERLSLLPVPALNDDATGADRIVAVKAPRWPLVLILTGLVLSVAWMSLLAYGAYALVLWLSA